MIGTLTEADAMREFYHLPKKGLSMANERKYEKPLDDLEKAHEEQYFHELDVELTKKLHDKLHPSDNSSKQKPDRPTPKAE